MITQNNSPDSIEQIKGFSYPSYYGTIRFCIGGAMKRVTGQENSFHRQFCILFVDVCIFMSLNHFVAFLQNTIFLFKIK